MCVGACFFPNCFVRYALRARCFLFAYVIYLCTAARLWPNSGGNAPNQRYNGDRSSGFVEHEPAAGDQKEGHQ